MFNKWYWENWISHTKEWNSSCYTLTKVYSKCIRHLNLRPETKTPRRKHRGKKKPPLVLALIFWIWHQCTESKIKNQVRWHQTNKILQSKSSKSTNWRSNPWNGLKYWQSILSDKGLMDKTCKKFIQISDNKKSFKNGQRRELWCRSQTRLGSHVAVVLA